jgi:glutamate-1-semialdehyde 2,1-aminomutase
MHTGYAAMSQIYTPEVCIEFNALGEWLRLQLVEVTKGTKAYFTGVGTIMALHITDSGIEGFVRGDEETERSDLKDLFWMEMMEQRYWISRRGSINLILGTPKAELKRFVGCVKVFLDKYEDLMVIK